MTGARIGLTLGDPGGVGPEIVIKTAAKFQSLHSRPVLIIFGDGNLIQAEAAGLGIKLETQDYPSSGMPEAGVYIFHIPAGTKKVIKGVARKENGAASFRFFEEAVRSAGRGELEAVVTAPIAKSAWGLAGLPWRGHTEYLSHLYPGAIMTFWSDRLRVALFTHHMPLAQAVREIKRDKLVGFLENLDRSLSRSSSRPKEFAVAGLNPHAGEEGLLGREEIEEVIPALEKARLSGIPVSGPYPPDTVFLKALDNPDVLVVALYHDQGLIGFKLVSFASGVNATFGLPFVRTSPDHGTAFDIAGRGLADESSFKAAVELAVELSGKTGKDTDG